MRSIECNGVGLRPMSAKKAEKELRHRSHTVIPSAPYLLNDLLRGFSHLFFIPVHILCSAVLFLPCVVFDFLVASIVKHPHDCVCPFFRLHDATIVSLPQVHLQFHLVLPELLLLARDMTVNRPKESPERSLKLCIISSVRYWSVLASAWKAVTENSFSGATLSTHYYYTA